MDPEGTGSDISATLAGAEILLRAAAGELAEYRSSLADTRLLLQRCEEKIKELGDFLAEVDKHLYKQANAVPTLEGHRRNNYLISKG